MARLVKATCPQCGAGVQLDPAYDWVTCSYCRTSSFIRKDKQQAPPQNVAAQYQVIDISAATRAGAKAMITWSVVAAALAIFGGVVPMVVGALSAGGAARAVSNLASGAAALTVSDRAMLGDVTGDEALDPIVPSWAYSNGKSEKLLFALDAHTGKTVWTSESLGTTDDNLVLGAVGRTALIGSTTALSGVDLRSGKRLWQQQLPEKVEKFCDDGQGGAAFVAKNQQVYGIELTTGQLTPKGKLRDQSEPPYTPEQIASFSPRIRPTFQKRVDDWERERRATVPCAPASSPEYWSRGAGLIRLNRSNLDIDGFSVSEVWQEREQGPLFVIGSRREGSRIPMIAVTSAAGKLLWKAELPTTNPLGATEGDPATFTFARGRAISAYFHKANKQLMVSAWALDSGQRYWEVAIAADDARWPGIALSDRHVFVRNGSALHAFALSDGRALWQVGK